MECKGLITGIQRFSIHDGPGIRTVVFFKGCPLNCPWCSNPETRSTEKEMMYLKSKCILCGMCIENCEFSAISPVNGETEERGIAVDRALCRKCFRCISLCPAEALRAAGAEMEVSEVMDEILKDEAFYRKSGGGVTFSGGEPFMQSEFLKALAKKCQKSGISTAIETSAFAEWEDIKNILPFIDMMLCDMKIFDEDKHCEIIGADNSCIKDNIARMSKAGKEVIVRIPVVPGFTEDEENIMSIGDFALSSGIKNIHLLPYHNYGAGKYRQLGRNYRLSGIKPLDKNELTSIKEKLEATGLIVQIGG